MAACQTPGAHHGGRAAFVAGRPPGRSPPGGGKKRGLFPGSYEKEKRLIHDRACDLVTGKGKKCSCMRSNPYLTEKARKELEERGYFDKLHLEDIQR
jgi:hypothetical protein